MRGTTREGQRTKLQTYLPQYIHHEHVISSNYRMKTCLDKDLDRVRRNIAFVRTPFFLFHLNLTYTSATGGVNGNGLDMIMCSIEFDV